MLQELKQQSRMRVGGWLYLLLAMLALLIALPATAQIAGDTDGDGVPDDLDLCFREPGDAGLYGCPPEAFATFTDFDGDGVIDPLDACYDLAGAAENSGCPPDVTPDLDYDGLPDGLDSCPRQFGAAEANGCPPDRDADGVPDASDACPDAAGDLPNLGCPVGVAPPDRDADGVADVFDTCPDAAGQHTDGGCPDTDGDTVPDVYDMCPTVAGDPNLIGCSPQPTTTLPASRQPITAATAGLTAQVGQIAVGLPQFGVAANGALAVRASTRLLLYNLNVSDLAPLVDVDAVMAGYPVGISGDGSVVGTFQFPPDFSGPPFLVLRDAATGAEFRRLETPNDGAVPAFSGFLFSPRADHSLLALAYNGANGFIGQPTTVDLYDARGEAKIAALPMPDSVINLAFSGDGSRLAADSAQGEAGIARVWDVATGQEVATLPTVPFLHFLGTPLALDATGRRLALGFPNGGFALWEVSGAQPAQIYAEQLFSAELGEVVSAVAFSPDGSVIAAAGGAPFSGGLVGQERFPVFLLDAVSGAVIAELAGHRGLVRNLAFTADGTLLITAADSTVRFWGVL